MADQSITPESLIAELKRLKEDYAALQELNEAYEAELSKVSSTPTKEEEKTFEHDGKNYGFALPGVNHKEKVIYADDVIQSIELQKELVEIGSGMIYEK